MPYNIAVAGKGGTGKTTVASLVIGELVEKELTPVLAVDADPNATLSEALNIDVPSTLGDILAESRDRENIPASMDKRRHIEFQISTALAENSGFDLMVMGRTEGPGCYCSVNDILRSYMDELMPNYEYAVLDNEAGMEHISRRTTRDIDLLLIVSDENPIGVRSAGRIHELVKDLEINVGSTYLVLNRARGDVHPRLQEEIDKLDLDLAGTIPDDKVLVDYNLEQRSLLDLPQDSQARKAVAEMMDELMA
ncbi:AAA family ATPase [Halarsenatibacter silvermanii]|uniref:CO dehydrogenase maturation factor n=1 Tax=Halarsenatibacter silvermanii TaxID=321763 RepID=A0A1G9H5I8_9FIRM|nr:AAA family ATPase [Halarsenatibacter silvermanii]SDL08109.1 CO dehydrogenase maturation factor [Halarsenatibacter silvermanii]